MEPFLKSVANYMYSAYGNKLHEVVMVFPNRRAGLFFNKYLTEIIDSPILSPKHYTINDLLEKHSAYAIADEITLLFRLYRSYCKVAQSPQPFDFFYPYCKTLLADFDDIEKYHVKAADLFKNLRNLKNLEAYKDYLTDNQKKALENFWQTFQGQKVSDEQKEFASFWDLLHNIYTNFTENLKAEKLAYEGMVYREVSTDCSRLILPGVARGYAFVGFNALNASEIKIFNWLQNNKKAIFFWDYDKHYVTPPVSDYHEAGYFLRDLTKRFPAPSGFSFTADITSPKNIEIIDVPSKTGQVNYLSSFLEKTSAGEKLNSNDLLIGLGDEGLLQNVIHNLPENIGEINVSMGYPGNKTNAFQLVLQFADMYSNLKSNNTATKFHFNNVVGILKQPLLKQYTDSQKTMELNNFVVERNLIYIDKRFIDNYTDIRLSNVLFNIHNGADGILGHLISVIGFIIENEILNDNNVHIVEKETLVYLQKQLNDFKEVFNQYQVKMNQASFIKLLKSFLQGVQIPFSGEPLKGAQIMGVLETRTLDFKNVILLSMNEGVFPKASNIPSMIPYNLRKGFELPTPEHRDAIFSYYFYRLLHRSENAVLVYCSADDGMNKGEASRFLLQLLYNPLFNVKKSTIHYTVYPEKTKPVLAQRTGLINRKLDKYISGNNTLTPSAINTYIGCKLKFYFRHLEKLKPREEPTVDIEANVFGSILHLAMSLLYQPLKDKLITAESITNILKNKQLIELSIDKAFKGEFFHTDSSEGIQYQGQALIVREVIKKYIENILRYDARNAPSKILMLEEKIEIKYPLNNGSIYINLGGIADRVDEWMGKTRIVDYKTGTVDLAFESIEGLFFKDPSVRNGAAFQTMLYAMVLQQSAKTDNILPALFFTRNLNNPNYQFNLKIGEPRKKTDVHSFNDYYREFKEYLDMVLTDLFLSDSNFTQTNDRKFCEYCDYKSICKR